MTKVLVHRLFRLRLLIFPQEAGSEFIRVCLSCRLYYDRVQGIGSLADFVLGRINEAVKQFLSAIGLSTVAVRTFALIWETSNKELP